MIRSILSTVAPFAFIFAAASAFASSSSPVNVDAGNNLYTRDGEFGNELIPSDVDLVLANVTIVGFASHATPTHKVWTCGNVEANLVGGSQRTCEYR
jgi:hypothetical protein